MTRMNNEDRLDMEETRRRIRANEPRRPAEEVFNQLKGRITRKMTEEQWIILLKALVLKAGGSVTISKTELVRADRGYDLTFVGDSIKIQER